MHRTLGGAVSRQAGVGDESIIGAKVNHAGPRRFPEQRQSVLGCQECPGHVDGEYPVPVVKAGLLDGFFDFNARRVNQDIEFVPVFFQAFEQGNSMLLAGDVKRPELNTIPDPTPVFQVSILRISSSLISRRSRCSNSTSIASPLSNRG